MKLSLLAILISFSLFSFAQQNHHKTSKRLFYGHWTSQEDKKYSIVVSATSVIEYYDKEKTGAFSYTIKKDKLIETNKGDGSMFNYQIIKLTKSRLTLLYTDRGNMLKFKRRGKMQL